ncbi:unnamed protein product [Phytophthora fragariaefolia]|uniref:Unnamed protein product n=1 Tax=Phytophthora fragariaefolia TaxID=1490495 RepID=A0A9W6XZ37_9STRA|nr:unnamed protein product [Phytophthora fragariaefolia]
MGLRCAALWLALLVSAHCGQVCGDVDRVDTAAESAVLMHLLDAEVEATRRQLQLYKRKTELLADTIRQLQTQLGDTSGRNETSPGALYGDSVATQQRRQRPRDGPQIFSDWFEPQGSFSSFGEEAENSSRVFAQLVSFRPSTSPGNRRYQASSRRKAAVDDDLPLQFLLVLDPRSTIIRLFHPTTCEILWQHALNLRSSSGDVEFQVADAFFISDRSSYLAVLLTSGDLALFKLRLWHARRVASGDNRRLKPLRESEDNNLQCPAGQDSLADLDPSLPPWLLWPPTSSLTSPAPGKYIHVDFDRIFGAALNSDWNYDRGKVAVVAQHYRVFVVASDSSGGHLSIFSGDNGTFMNDIHTQSTDSAVQLEPIHSSRGLIALATHNRVFFADSTKASLVPVSCKAPGRHTFTSLAADPVRPSVIYVGTSTGRALVFKLHNIGAWRQRSNFTDQSSRDPIMCTLVDQLMPRLPSSISETPAVVQTLQSFLVLGTGSQLVLYQLSGSSEEVRPMYLSERSMVGSFQKAQVMSLSAAKDLLVHSTGFAALVAVPSSPGDYNAAGLSYRLDLYESRIPPPGNNMDLSWIRVPAMMICALAAMFWQQKGRLAYSAGGRRAFNDAELAGILSGRGVPLPGMGSMKRSGMHGNQRASDWY